MGFLDGIKSLGRGLGSIPGKLNEARYDHRTVMVPIGVNPNTGEEITIPQDELIAKGMYDPASGQVSMPKTVRTGPSKFGNFVSQGLPRMLEAGIAAATTPGHRTDGGALSVLRGMQVGRDQLEKRDMMAYQANRQRRQDAAMEQERASRTAENQAQAERYKWQMEQGGKEPHVPTSYQQVLVQRLLSATDPAERASLEEKLKIISQGGQQRNKIDDMRVESDEWARRAKQVWGDANPPERERYELTGLMSQSPSGVGQVQWSDIDGGKQQAYELRIDPVTGKVIATPIPGLTRAKPKSGTGGDRVKPATRRDFFAVTTNKAKALRDAEESYSKDIAEMRKKFGLLGKDGKTEATEQEENDELTARRAARLVVLEKHKRQIQSDYEEGINMLNGSVMGNINNPMVPAGKTGAPAGQLPGFARPRSLGGRTQPNPPGPEPWERLPGAGKFIGR